MENKPTQELSTFRFGTATWTRFGVLKGVTENPGWIILENAHSQRAFMKKVYPSWVHVYRKATSLIGQHVVYETGELRANIDNDIYFRNIYGDDSSGFLFYTPDGSSNTTQKLFIRKSLTEENLRWLLNDLRESFDKLQEDADIYRKNLDALAEEDMDDIERSIKALDEQWHSFQENPNRTLVITGAAHTEQGHPQNIDKKFIMRMGIDTTSKKRINVKVLKRGKKNKLKVSLPNYNNEQCTVAVKIGNKKGIMGEWSIVSVEPDIPGWMSMEHKHHEGAKTLRKPVDYFMDIYNDVASRVAND